ncbi:competence protein ComGB [Bacilli bacterium PM5-9]|nr:competence protein ComGB [Bacilli bacterium PM5-9]
MKVNEDIVLKLVASTYRQGYSLNKILDTLLQFNLIDKKMNYDIKEKLKQNLSLIELLNNLIKNKVIIEYIIFYHNYYSLSDAIEKSIAISKEKQQIKKEIVSSLVYPVILIVMTSFALLFISQYIVPQLIMLNPSAVNDYNYIIFFLKFVPLYISIFIILLIVIYFISIKLIKSNFIKYISIFIKIPFVSFAIKYYSTFMFALYLKEIIKNVPLSSDSIFTLKKQTNNIFVKFLCETIIIRLKKGDHVFMVINSSNLLQNDLKQTLLLANNSKEMSLLLDDYFELKIDILKKKIKVFLAVFVPIIVSFIGVLLILMYLLIMLPVLNMSATL